MLGAGEPFQKHQTQGTLLLRPSRKKWSLMILGAAALVAACLFLAVSEQGAFSRIVGWFGVIFFGLGGLAAVANLTTKSFLMLTAGGFAVRGLGRQYTTRWCDVEGFWSVRPPSIYPISKMVVYNFA